MSKKGVVVLAAMLAVSAMGSNVMVGAAENDAYNLYDLTLKIGGEAYSFPMTLDECREAGMDLQEDMVEKELGFVNVNVEDQEYTIYVEEIDGEYVAYGFKVNLEDLPDVEAAGINWSNMTLGKLDAQYASRIAEADTKAIGSGEAVSFETFQENYRWFLIFDGETEDAKVNQIEMKDSIPEKYGMNFEKTEAEEGLPDAASMPDDSFILNGKYFAAGTTVQNLLDAGWVFEEKWTESDKLNGRKNKGMVDQVSVLKSEIYDGEGVAKIEAYNQTEQSISYEDAEIIRVSATEQCNADLVLAGGLSLESSLDDFKEMFGEPVNEDENERNGRVKTTYRFEKEGEENSPKYLVTVCEDKIVQIELDLLK